MSVATVGGIEDPGPAPDVGSRPALTRYTITFGIDVDDGGVCPDCFGYPVACERCRGKGCVGAVGPPAPFAGADEYVRTIAEAMLGGAGAWAQPAWLRIDVQIGERPPFLFEGRVLPGSPIMRTLDVVGSPSPDRVDW